MGQLILKRAPIGPNLEDYDVLADGILVTAFSCRRPRQTARRGCGHSPTASTRTARPAMATSRRARPPWWHSPRAGDGNRATVPLAWPLVRSIALAVIRNGGTARAALAGFLRLPGRFPAVVAGGDWTAEKPIL